MNKIALTLFFLACLFTGYSQQNIVFSGEATAAISISNCSVEHDADIPNFVFSPVYNVGLGIKKEYNENRALEFLLNSYYVKYKHHTGKSFTFPSQDPFDSSPAKEYNYADMIYLGPTIGLHFERTKFTWFSSLGVQAPIYKKSNYYYYSEGVKIDQINQVDFEEKAPLRAQAKLGILLGNRSTKMPQMKIFYAFDFVPKYENSTLKSTFSSIGVGLSF